MYLREEHSRWERYMPQLLPEREALMEPGYGLALATLTMPYVQDLLYEVNPRDGATFAAVPVILFLTSLAASFLSARQATRVDPMEALRAD